MCVLITENAFSSIFVILHQKGYTPNALFTQTTGRAPTVRVTNWLLDSLLSETHSYHSASVVLTAQFHIFSSQCAQTYCCHNNLASAIKKLSLTWCCCPWQQKTQPVEKLLNKTLYVTHKSCEMWASTLIWVIFKRFLQLCWCRVSCDLSTPIEAYRQIWAWEVVFPCKTLDVDK